MEPELKRDLTRRRGTAERGAIDPSRIVRAARIWAASFTGAQGIRVEHLPGGLLSAEMHARITEFERRIATADVGGQSTICDQGRDYSRFWRAIGRARAFAATDTSGRIVGVGAAVGMRLRMPSGRTRRATYLGHLRVLPECRFGPAIAAISARLGATAGLLGPTVFGVVSERSGFHPERVAKGMGAPSLELFGTFTLLYFESGFDDQSLGQVRDATESEARSAYMRFTRDMIASTGGTPQMRSGRAPRWLITADGGACACIEDCDLVRRWIQPDGSHLAVMSLSFFGWESIHSAAAIVRAALAIAHAAGVPQVRMIIDDSVVDGLVDAIGIAPKIRHAWSTRGYSPWGMPTAAWSLHPTEL